MKNPDKRVDLNPIEIEMLLAAIDYYEGKVRKKRADTILHALKAVRKKLTIASQGVASDDRSD